jgi:hypothetical protein
MITKHDYRAELRSLLLDLGGARYRLCWVDYGEDRLLAPTLDEALDYGLCTDESVLAIRKTGTEKNYWLLLVVGNGPGELVADYSGTVPDDLQAVLDRASEYGGSF